MKKLIFVFISILLLASCAHVSGGNVSVSLYSPAPSLPSPSPTQGFTSCEEGERVSEYFYTRDLERFFTMPAGELCNLLGSDYELSSQSWNDIYSYSSLSASFGYDLVSDDKNIIIDFGSDDELIASLQNIILYDFNFRGLSKFSSFDDVLQTFGKTDLLTKHGDNYYGKYHGGYYYALHYVFGAFRFEFSCSDVQGAEGLTLTIMPSTAFQVFYKSCDKGDRVSPTLTTGDIKKFLTLAPEDLDGIAGNGSSNFNEDTGEYGIYFEYLGAGFYYDLEEEDQGDKYLIYPGPLEYVWINDFDYLGLNKASTFKDVMNKLGETTVCTGYGGEGDEYYYVQYKIDGMMFEFSGSDKQASDGVWLSIYSGN